jgi:hypothetical protein
LIFFTCAVWPWLPTSSSCLQGKKRERDTQTVPRPPKYWIQMTDDRHEKNSAATADDMICLNVFGFLVFGNILSTFFSKRVPEEDTVQGCANNVAAIVIGGCACKNSFV